MRGRTKCGDGRGSGLRARRAGCGSSGSSDAAKTAPGSTTPPTTSITNVVVTPNGVKVIPGSATGKSPCEKAAPTPASPGEVGAGTGGSEPVKTAAGVAAAEEHGARGKVEQVPLTAAEQKVLERPDRRRRSAVAKKFPTVKDALGRRLREVDAVRAVHRRALHEHRARSARSIPPQPSELLYDGTTPDSKIVGLSYLVYHPSGPPPGFAGAERPLAPAQRERRPVPQGRRRSSAARRRRREQCARLGGRKTLLTDIWMVHAWIVPGFDVQLGHVLAASARARRPPVRQRVRVARPDRHVAVRKRHERLSAAVRS